MKKIMFDMDGTLIDSMSGWINSYKVFLEKNNLIEDDDLKIKLQNKSLFKKGKEIIEHFNLELTQSELYHINIEEIIRLYNEDFQLKNGVFESLEYLKNKNYNLSINTATKEYMCKGCIERLDLRKYFNFVQTPEDKEYVKYDLAFYEDAIKMHDVEPENILFFDDNTEFLNLAKSLGIKTVLVYDEHSNSEIFDECEDFDYKIKEINVENLKKLGL